MEKVMKQAGLKLNIKPGIKVNYPAIAKGVYAMFTEDEKAVMAFGMFPLGKMELAEKEMRRKCARIALDHCDIEATEEAIAEWSAAVDKDVVSDFNHNLSVAILTEAKTAGMLVV